MANFMEMSINAQKMIDETSNKQMWFITSAKDKVSLAVVHVRKLIYRQYETQHYTS